MIAKRFNAKEFTVNLKATIQKTGKLGFTQETMEKLQLTTDCSIFIAPDEENKKVMYMGVLRYKHEEAFHVLGSGKYVYLNTINLFKSLKLDFDRKVYIFDLTRYEEGDEVMEAECYKMEMRVRERTSEDKE